MHRLTSSTISAAATSTSWALEGSPGALLLGEVGFHVYSPLQAELLRLFLRGESWAETLL